MKQPSKSCCRRTGYKLECGEEEWRGGEETEGFCMVAKLADVELWGAEGWAGKDSETALCSWESPMEKFLWHFVLRGGQFQRGWNHSAGIWVRRVMLQSIPQVWAGLKPGSNLCSPIPIFHTAQTPREWMDWHKAPLLKCRCLKAPKISLNQLRVVGANKNCAMVWRAEVWVVHGHKCFYWTAAICPLFIKTQGWMLWSTEEDRSCEVSMEGSGYCKL